MWKQPKCLSIDEWISKMCVRTMEYYSLIKGDEVLKHATTWMCLGNMLGERSGHIFNDHICIKFPEYANL